MKDGLAYTRRFIKYVFVTLITVALAGILFVHVGSTSRAQSGDNGWSKPDLLFEGDGQIFEPVVIADQNGAVHVFWAYSFSAANSEANAFSEANSDADELRAIYYTRWDGEVWTKPLDIVASKGANSPSAIIDPDGKIHLLWWANQLYYSQAPVAEAKSARAWTRPLSVDRTYLRTQIVADSTGRLHIVYPGTGARGPYYQSSDDGGVTWARPVNISETSGPGLAADYVELAISDSGNLHVVWTELELPAVWPPKGVFYSHSIDGGQTWLDPIEIAGEGYVQINVAVVNDSTVHVAWNGSLEAGGGRFHRWSSDSGRTWSEAVSVMPGGGTTDTPALVVDSAKTLHLLASANNCVWYSIWHQQRWADPVCISGEEAMASGWIEDLSMTVSEGNRLHAVFWDDRKRLWYTTKQTSAPAVPPIPFPTRAPTPTVLPTASPTPAPTATAGPTASAPLDKGTEAGPLANPTQPILLGILPAALIIGGMILARVIHLSHR